MRKHTAVFLFSIALFAACKKETATGTIPEPNNTYKDEFTPCNCAENNNHVEISTEVYFLSADGYLMPTKKDQAAPDLRYFNLSKE